LYIYHFFYYKNKIVVIKILLIYNVNIIYIIFNHFSNKIKFFFNKLNREIVENSYIEGTLPESIGNLTKLEKL